MLYSADIATFGLMNQKERVLTLGYPAMSVLLARGCRQAKGMDMYKATHQCPTCLRFFPAYAKNKRYCRDYCANKKSSPTLVETVCETCGHRFRFFPGEAGTWRSRFCAASCNPSSLHRELPSKAVKKVEKQYATYERDEELYAQQMAYTLNGITWWATPCCYCGDPYEEDEHVLPQAAFKKLQAVGNISIPQDLLRIVPSCHECNSVANDKVFQSFEEKKLFVKAAIAKRYYPTLSYPHWDAKEIRTLEGRTKEWIAHGQDIRNMVFERLRF